MPLRNYGLLTGTLIEHGPQPGGNPHYTLRVKAGLMEYRVAVNLQSTRPQGDCPAPLQYQIRNDLDGSKLAKSIRNHDTFLIHSVDRPCPTIDYVRDGFLDMSKFRELSADVKPGSNPFYKAFVKAANDAKTKGAFVAVFGTGYPDQDDQPDIANRSPLRASATFTGVDNVHMNQGSFLRVDTHRQRHFDENGPHQDGAVLFFLPNGKVQGFFAKFESQDAQTDHFGNPTHTGVAELDSNKAIKPAARKALIARPPALARLARAATSPSTAARGRRHHGPPPPVGGSPNGSSEIPLSGTSGGTPAGGFIFNDPNPLQDPTRPFKPDDDSQYRNSPFVEGFAKYGVPEPVPGPRNGAYPTMKLQDVLGQAAVNSITNNNQIVFHVAGDTGAADASKLPNEQTVAELMTRDFDPGIASPELPKFYYHVGDVVYYYGEEQYYYDQFYKPYKDYPAPIFAIPGNHDGITYLQTMPSLAGFINAFCDDQPRHWSGAGGIGRSTLNQPGVYFTLDCPFISIIGLYSNCSESYGYLDDQQKLFLYNELVRLKPLRQNGSIVAVLLAVHHSPLSFSNTKASSSDMRDAIDTACNQAGFWPDAVLSGHAHIYQRITRLMTTISPQREIPHIIVGCGGYALTPTQEVDKADMLVMNTSDPNNHLHQFLVNYGYLRATVTPGDRSNPPTLRTEFHSPSLNAGQATDVCVLDLDKHKVL